MNWYEICPIDEVPLMGARNVKFNGVEIAVFRLSNGSIRAVDNRCPHKGGPLSEGIVSGEHVICPLHSWKISLIHGSAMPPDEGKVRTYEVRAEEGKVWLKL